MASAAKIQVLLDLLGWFMKDFCPEVWFVIVIILLTFEKFVKRRFNCIAKWVKYFVANCIHKYLFFISLTIVLNMIKALDFLKSLETLLCTVQENIRKQKISPTVSSVQRALHWFGYVNIFIMDFEKIFNKSQNYSLYTRGRRLSLSKCL